MTVGTTLLIGEICIDFTITGPHSEPKMRLGGIIHAARGLWAAGIQYAVAGICPTYLVSQARDYLEKHGCSNFIHLGTIDGAPNVIVIQDVREVGHQGYEDILRDSRVTIFNDVGDRLKLFDKIVVFPGRYDLVDVLNNVNANALLTLDVAYDLKSIDDLKTIAQKIFGLVISTSSELFQLIASKDVVGLVDSCKNLGATCLLLKENRGGSRVFNLGEGSVFDVPAQLSETVNSVGVGDVYTAIFGSLAEQGTEAAAFRGMQAATNYALTTYPDDFRAGVQRDFALPIEIVRGLGGVSLPWHNRSQYQIYLAAPDFSYANNPEIEAAVSSLEYHNFSVRRPIKENGEADRGSHKSALREFYEKDVSLLHECDLILAIPLDRDPGTLVEIGMGIQLNKPIVVYDPRGENNNTMVVCGSSAFSGDLDICLNEVFRQIGLLFEHRT